MIVSAADVRVHLKAGRFSLKGKIVHFQELLFHFLQASKLLISLRGGFPHDSSPCAVVKLESAASGIVKLSDYIAVSACDVFDKLLV